MKQFHDKKLSIKMKVTLWYTGIIIFIVGFVLVFIFGITDQSFMLNTETELVGTVRDFAEEIDFAEETFYLDHDVEFYDDGVSISLYDAHGKMLAGTVPKQFPSSVTLKTDENQIISLDNSQWMIHDIALKYGNDQIIWIRGIISLSMTHEMIHIVFLTVLIFAPIVVLFSSLGGYYITKRAFQPVEEICKAADLIENGNDLSQRIPLHGSKDELDNLSQTFNHMFERLEESFEKEKQFTSDSSHELRTPISVILSQCEYALLPETPVSEQKECLQTILHQAQKMSHLVSQLLSFARSEHAKDSLTFEAVNISEVADLVSDELAEHAASRNIQIHRDLQNDIIIDGDMTLLMRLFLNLMTNALQYGKQGGYVKVSLYIEEDHVVGVIADNGIGIPSSEIDKIWRRFYRGDKNRVADHGNLGLGLSMVQWIIELHRGTISVESEPDVGTAFTFALPLRHFSQ